jgi:multiple sugar transport system ATP-binding protein
MFEMTEVVFDRVSKRFRNGTEAVSSFSLDISDGEFMVFVGPSGCGKTTALRMVAGLEDISSGTIRIGDRVVNDVPPQQRDVAMVFQNYALYPHMTVRENMAFALSLKRRPRREVTERVDRAASLLGLDELLARKPRELSGGQRQRVAMGRAIVREPQAFLMDEPLSNLDAKLRVQMRAEIAELQRKLNVTTIYVTHDQTEAMTMGDRVAVLRRGMLQQVDEPETLYEHPANLFVAGFIGSPAMNIVEATLDADRGAPSAVFGSHRLELPADVFERKPALRNSIGSSVILGVRPEAMADAALTDAPSARRMAAVCKLREALGADVLLHFDVDAPPVVTEDVKELAVDVDSGAVTALEERARAETTTFVARVVPQSRIREGDRFQVAVDISRLHFFDRTTNETIEEILI